jgi:hypothetical protein
MNADLEAALERLPGWQPRTDFAIRLAAAAARQSACAASAPAHPARHWLWRIADTVPLVVGALLLALLLSTLPWLDLVQHPAFAWLLCGGSASLGLILALRQLRAP